MTRDLRSKNSIEPIKWMKNHKPPSENANPISNFGCKFTRDLPVK